jgi:HD-like signal output (HDOD) protein
MTPPATAKVTPIRPTATEAAGAQRRHNEGHGRRLTAAFEALEAFPALAESRDRLLRLVTAERISPGDVVAAVESDVALVIAVLRLANQVEGRSRGRVESVVEAVELLSPEAVQGLAARARTFDFFERSS